MLHSIDCEDIALDVLVELLKFLRCDGMQGQFCFCKTLPLIYDIEFSYEKKLYSDLFRLLASRKLSPSVMLLITMIISTADKPDHSYIKVKFIRIFNSNF